MKHFIGIDLGTTNSAIASYDGSNIRIWKSPEQTDVTPSAIYVDRRGHRYYGMKAYNQAAANPDNSAVLFKRFMGTSSKIKLKSTGEELTPEQCSAEILKILFGYLPEEIRNDPETATVITVPAAFNQMKKDATLQAARLAGIGNVALMQEPVAAVMSIMRLNRKEGLFLVYDLGGGTFDVSIAENIGGRVNLLSHNGVEMCGGRDIDRNIFDSIIIPWLISNFRLPQDLRTNPKFKALCRQAQWAAERAKIELSSNETAKIDLNEDEIRTLDLDGREIYLDIDLDRSQVDEAIEDIVEQTISACRETLEKAGLNANDLEKIVFVGGPTNYKPLRDRVSFELSVPANFDINPMTAVSEGAAIFAESIDWSTELHNRKTSNEVMETEMEITYKYTARVSSENAKLMCVLKKPMDGFTIELISEDSGWSSGRCQLKSKSMLSLPLSKDGDNHFKIIIRDSRGNILQTPGADRVVITRTLATIGAIPASHSIGVEVAEKLGGKSVLEFIVNEGDALPKRGRISFKAAQDVEAGSSDAINIKLWEGCISDPITDNRFIGMLKISGRDIESGKIYTGTVIDCEYEMSDSGTINLDVSIPQLGVAFTNRNFYSRQEGQMDLENVDELARQGRDVVERIDAMSEKVDDEKLRQAREKASHAASIDSSAGAEPEDIQKASNELLEAKKLIDRSRRENLRQIRELELEGKKEKFELLLRNFADDQEAQRFDSLVSAAERVIDLDDSQFDDILSELESVTLTVLMHQDWFIIQLFNQLIENPREYADQSRFANLRRLGEQQKSEGRINELRMTIGELLSIRISDAKLEGMTDIANIIKM